MLLRPIVYQSTVVPTFGCCGANIAFYRTNGSLKMPPVPLLTLPLVPMLVVPLVPMFTVYHSMVLVPLVAVL